MPPSLAAQAAQSAAQGQQQLASYNSQAADANNSYNTYSGQADQANTAVNAYTTGMQGAYDPTTGNGNAGSAYTYELGNQLGQLGYDPAQMTAARNNLNQSNGALSAYSDYANQAASKFGLNAGGFAAANSGALSGLNNNIAAQQGVVNGLSGLYTTAQTGANQFAGQTVQGEQNTLGGLQDVYANAAKSRDTAQSNLQFFSNLAQQQGGLNASQQQAYAAAQAAYASASQSLAQATYLASQTAGQNLQNQANQVKQAQAEAAAQATASKNLTSGQVQTYTNQGMSPAATVGNKTGNPVYSASF